MITLEEKQCKNTSAYEAPTVEIIFLKRYDIITTSDIIGEWDPQPTE